MKWLDENKGDYVAVGPLQVMGYHSPFIPRDQNFFEVQIPVKPPTASPKGTSEKTDTGG